MTFKVSFTNIYCFYTHFYQWLVNSSVSNIKIWGTLRPVLKPSFLRFQQAQNHSEQIRTHANMDFLLIQCLRYTATISKSSIDDAWTFPNRWIWEMFVHHSKSQISYHLNCGGASKALVCINQKSILSWVLICSEWLGAC